MKYYMHEDQHQTQTLSLQLFLCRDFDLGHSSTNFIKSYHPNQQAYLSFTHQEWSIPTAASPEI